MVQPRLALILYFCMVVHKAACYTLSKAFLEVQVLQMLEVIFTQDSKVEDLFCGAPFGSEPSLCSSAIISSAWDFSPLKMTFSMILLKRLMRLIVL